MDTGNVSITAENAEPVTPPATHPVSLAPDAAVETQAETSEPAATEPIYNHERKQDADALKVHVLGTSMIKDVKKQVACITRKVEVEMNMMPGSTMGVIHEGMVATPDPRPAEDVNHVTIQAASIDINNHTTGKCRLCNREKWYIMFKPDGATINDRSEFYSTCRHRTQNLLSRIKS